MAEIGTVEVVIEPRLSIAWSRLEELTAAVKRQTDALDALVDANPEGLTADELRDVGRRFAQLCEEAGPRRGLCRFER